MVVGVREDEAFNSLHELRLIVLEEPSDASTTSRVSHNGERRGWALSLSHEILPNRSFWRISQTIPLPQTIPLQDNLQNFLKNSMHRNFGVYTGSKVMLKK